MPLGRSFIGIQHGLLGLERDFRRITQSSTPDAWTSDGRLRRSLQFAARLLEAQGDGVIAHAAGDVAWTKDAWLARIGDVNDPVRSFAGLIDVGAHESGEVFTQGLASALSSNMLNMIGIAPFITIPAILATMGRPQAMLAGRIRPKPFEWWRWPLRRAGAPKKMQSPGKRSAQAVRRIPVEMAAAPTARLPTDLDCRSGTCSYRSSRPVRLAAMPGIGRVRPNVRTSVPLR